MKKIILLLLALTNLLIINSCQKDIEAPINTTVSVTDNVVPGGIDATISGTIKCLVTITRIELCIDIAEDMPNPTKYDIETTNKSFSLNISNLNDATTYYYKYKVYTPVDEKELEVRSFTTLPTTIPTVTTNNVSSITTNRAVCGGNVTDAGNLTVTARGVCWSTSPNPTIDNSKTTDGSGTGTFTSNIIGLLTENTTYYIRAYATNSKGTAYGEERSFTTLQSFLPTVTTNNVSSITINSAVCGGNVTNAGNLTVTARGVCWSTSPNPKISNSKTTDGRGVGAFNSNITGLREGTTYYVRAYATNSKGTAYGEEKSFTTLSTTIPTVTTNNISSITANSAVCGGNVSDAGNLTVTARGVCWSTSPNPTINDSKTTNGSGMGIFTSNITGLTDGITYYVRAYATNSKGTAYGEERSFTTLPATIPTVTTNNVSSITANRAVCRGNVTYNGGLTVTARGVCWSTSPNPSINNSKTTDGSGVGRFTSNITGLTENTTYYVRAYATNAVGTAYGEEKSFTTSPSTGGINGHNWVDLGLPSGLKWATCNVGATTPEGYGNYYAWGETTTKTEYTEQNSVTYGQQMSDISGNSAYDAARANWGGTWRMPTKAEMEELVNNCTWQWTTQNGVNGYRVTGTNGNSIFLPAAGRCRGTSHYLVGEDGYYWSSTPDESNGSRTYYLQIYSGGHGVYWYSRYFGFTVRPVSE